MLDVERTLVLDLNAFCLLEEQVEKMTGNRNLFTAIDWLNLNLRDFTLVVWAALMTHYPDITLVEVRSMITLSKFHELRPIIDMMVSDSMPPSETPKLKEGEELVPETEEEKKTIAAKTA